MNTKVKQSLDVQTRDIHHFAYTDSPEDITIILGRCLRYSIEILYEDVLYFVSNIVNEFTKFTIFELPEQSENSIYGYYYADGASEYMSLANFYSKQLQPGFAIRFTISNSISQYQKVRQLQEADAVLSFIKNNQQNFYSSDNVINSDNLYSQTTQWIIEQNIQK